MTDSENQHPTEVVVDACGLICPQPVLMARRALSELRPGDRVVLLATDPHAEIDVEVFCQRTGHTLQSHENDGGPLRFTIICRPCDQ